MYVISVPFVGGALAAAVTVAVSTWVTVTVVT